MQDELSADDGLKQIVVIFHNLDPVDFLSEIYLDFNCLLSTRRHHVESMWNYEPGFEHRLDLFNCHSAGSISYYNKSVIC